MSDSGKQHVYSFDTSALIDGMERFYPIDNFPALWEKFDELIASGRLVVSEEAWSEATKKDAPLKDWCTEESAERARCVYLTDAAVGTVVGAISAAYPQWVQQGGKNQADPFVIAVAEVVGGMVISGERDGGPANPKIPYVCAQRGTPHGRVIDVIKLEKYRFA